MSRITILELFPLYNTCRKWGFASEKEIVRLEKEFTNVHKIFEENVVNILYKIDNRLHSKYNPARTRIHIHKLYRAETWYLNGIRHRINGPAHSYIVKDKVLSNLWYMNGKMCKPSSVYKNGYSIF